LNSEPKVMREHTLGRDHFDVFGQSQVAFLEFYPDWQANRLRFVDVAHVRVVAVLLLIALHRALDLVGDGAGRMVIEP